MVKGAAIFYTSRCSCALSGQDIRDALKNEWFSPSAAAARISGAQIADEVTRYSTLAELDEDQVEKAFWLGHALGEIRWRQIEQWREAFTTEPSSGAVRPRPAKCGDSMGSRQCVRMVHIALTENEVVRPLRANW